MGCIQLGPVVSRGVCKWPMNCMLEAGQVDIPDLYWVQAYHTPITSHYPGRGEGCVPWTLSDALLLYLPVCSNVLGLRDALYFAPPVGPRDG